MSLGECCSDCLQLQLEFSGMSVKEFDGCLPELVQLKKGVDGNQASDAKASQQGKTVVA